MGVSNITYISLKIIFQMHIAKIYIILLMFYINYQCDYNLQCFWQIYYFKSVHVGYSGL